MQVKIKDLVDKGYLDKDKVKEVDKEIIVIRNNDMSYVPYKTYESDSNSTSECSRITYAKSDSEYSMAARNFGKLPKDILDKMRSQHNLFDEES